MSALPKAALQTAHDFIAHAIASVKMLEALDIDDERLRERDLDMLAYELWVLEKARTGLERALGRLP